MPLLPTPKIKRRTDNRQLDDKCFLRRKVIKEASLEPCRVLDLFAGEGHIWSELRREHRTEADGPAPLEVVSYVPIDVAAKQNGQVRFKVTPRLIAALDLDNGLSRYNVIDVDCYGEPWSLWQAVLFRIKQPTAVFLTRGRVTYGAGRMPISNLAKEVMGIPQDWDVPGKTELMEYGDRCQLLQQCATAKIEFGYLTRLRAVDYYGLFITPR